jgi:hypothetical protein
MPAYFIVLESKIANFDEYVDGSALLKNGEELDRLAKKAGVKSLLSFFSMDRNEMLAFIEDNGGDVEKLRSKVPEEAWFPAEDGVKTVEALQRHLEKSEGSTSDKLAAELKDFARVLALAQANGTRWHLGIDY